MHSTMLLANRGLLLTPYRDAGKQEQEAITQTLSAAQKKFNELDADGSGYLEGKIALRANQMPSHKILGLPNPGVRRIAASTFLP